MRCQDFFCSYFEFTLTTRISHFIMLCFSMFLKAIFVYCFMVTLITIISYLFVNCLYMYFYAIFSCCFKVTLITRILTSFMSLHDILDLVLFLLQIYTDHMNTKILHEGTKHVPCFVLNPH